MTCQYLRCCLTINETHLGISRICIEDIGEEFACACDAGYNKSVNVVAVNDKEMVATQGSFVVDWIARLVV